LVVAHGADGHDRVKAIVPGARVHRLVAAAAGAGDAQAAAVHFRPGQQVVDRPLVLVHLQAAQRQSDRQQRGRNHLAVVFPQRLAESPLTRTERIHGQHEEPQLDQSQTPGLDRRILLGPAPMAVYDQHRGQLAGRSRNVGVRGHPNAPPRLEQDLLHAIAFALQRAHDARFQGTGLRRKPAPRGEHVSAQLRPPLLPFRQRRGSLVAGAKFRRLPADKLQERQRGPGLLSAGQRRQQQGRDDDERLYATHDNLHLPEQCCQLAKLPDLLQRAAQ